MNLPSRKMKELDAAFGETEYLFRDAQEQGLLRNAAFVECIENRLSSLRDSTVIVRSKVHSATTTLKQCIEMVKGLSTKISFLCRDVKNLRADISTSMAEEKLRLQQGNIPPSMSITNTGDLGDVVCDVAEDDATVCSTEATEDEPIGSCSLHKIDSPGRKTDTVIVCVAPNRDALHKIQLLQARGNLDEKEKPPNNAASHVERSSLSSSVSITDMDKLASVGSAFTYSASPDSISGAFVQISSAPAIRGSLLVTSSSGKVTCDA
ncbi:hypothetical protein EW146_g7038 [Bondarzewia mesenterica]|uniref:Uncharacterized protein n=1 Tax=Bondarzewia mesenterica TaxID=1095465 RepID=A0A4S4LNV4_9AGAM|nr:hypothetical protein EW146_g7038 [Bondarzewia mesenterica]